MNELLESTGCCGDISLRLNEGVVDTTKLADNAVTNAKLANGAVTSTKLANNAVTTNSLATGAVTYSKLNENVFKNVIGAFNNVVFIEPDSSIIHVVGNTIYYAKNVKNFTYWFNVIENNSIAYIYGVGSPNPGIATMYQDAYVSPDFYSILATGNYRITASKFGGTLYLHAEKYLKASGTSTHAQIGVI